MTTEEQELELKKLTKKDLVEMLYELIGDFDDLRDRLRQIHVFLDYIEFR